MQTTKNRINNRWIGVLEEEVLALDADTHVGRQVIEYLAALDVALNLMDEEEEATFIMHSAVTQVNAWYFG